jgi:hypothetical protein
MNPLQKVNLCPACCCCPEVSVFENEVTIGEDDNIVKLKKEEWNQLVEEIQRGALKQLA